MLSLTDCGCDHECSAGNEESFDCVCREGYILKNSYSAGIDFSRQNLTSTDVRFCRLKSIPALYGLKGL